MSEKDTPKEIWIYDCSDLLQEDYGLQVMESEDYEKYIIKNPDFKATKYLSESHHNEVVNELKAEIERLKAELGYHVCQYCGAETNTPDEQCYKAPKSI